MTEKKTNRLDYWNKAWKNNEAGWHRDEIHQFVEKYTQSYVQEISTNPKDIAVLVPLCGKCVDLYWLVHVSL